MVKQIINVIFIETNKVKRNFQEIKNGLVNEIQT